jgi:hypothetical protein
MAFDRSARVLLCSGALLLTQARAQAPLGEVSSADATVKGAVVVSASSTRVMSGSSVKAGLSTASVRLLRGGELRVCQGSSVSLTSSANGAQLMLGMSSGTLEAHYPIGNSRDSILTPDFEISLTGPAIFHLAVSTDEKGNTCVQSLQGDSGEAKVSELMGDGSYTVKPGEQVVFRAGHATNPGPVVGNCGCPAPLPLQRAAMEPPNTPAPATAAVAAPLPPIAPLIESSPRKASVTEPPPVVPPGGIHVQVEAPFVFRASELPPPRDVPVDLAEIRLSTLPVPGLVYAQPPPQFVAQESAESARPAKKKRHGLWGFLASIFKG